VIIICKNFRYYYCCYYFSANWSKK